MFLNIFVFFEFFHIVLTFFTFFVIFDNFYNFCCFFGFFDFVSKNCNFEKFVFYFWTFSDFRQHAKGDGERSHTQRRRRRAPPNR